jgi:hypothetical protein
MKLTCSGVVARFQHIARACRPSLFFALFLVTSLIARPLGAQYTTARLSGNTVDNTGAAVSGATVTVKQVTTGYSVTAKTGTAGEYVFPSLPVGDYELTVQMEGFDTYVQKGIILTVGQSANQNIALRLGSVSESVTVNENASLVTTSDASVGQLIGKKSMESLPMNGREAQQLVFLVPGAVNVSTQNCGANCEGGVLPGEQYAKVNGGGANGIYYLLDGVDYNDTYINTNLPFPSPDALQEFNVQTNNLSAAYGNATGGVVNILTKSGTDQIHGDVFEYLRNYAMDAKNYFATSPNPLKQNQFGATIGGPVLTKRLFYFGSYQGTRTNTANNGLLSFVPTSTERTGDFSDLGMPLVNPSTGDPYPNSQLPVDPVAAYLLQHIPAPNDPTDGPRALKYNGAPLVQNTDEFLIKADYNIGNHHISGHYFQLNYRIPIILPPTTNILAGNSETPQNLALKHISVVDIYTISGNLLLNSYFGFTSQTGATLSPAPFSIADAGAQIAQPSNFKPTLNIDISGNFSIGQQPATGNWNRGDQSLREILTIVRGNHQIEVGGEAVRVRAPMGNSYQADGNFNFNNSLTGDNVADFVSGNVSSFTQGGGLYLNFTGINWSAFVQDDWHVNSRLTLSAGLRWDPFIPYKDSDGRVGCFLPGARSVRFPNSPAGLIFGGSDHDAGCPESSIYNNLGNVGPRFGFASQLTADGKTSLRGGVGYYYQSPNLVAFEDVVGIPPFAPIVNLTGVNFTNPYASAGVTSPFPAQFGPSNPGSSANFPQNISFTQIFSSHYRLPQVLMTNLTLERGFGPSLLARVGYMGAKGTHLGGTGDQEAGLLQLNPATYIPGQSSEMNVQQRRAYPSFGFIDSINSGVNSNYNALQLSLEKRMAKGLSILTNFTWSKSLDDFGPSGEPGGLATNTCSCGRYFDYGPDVGDASKVFKFSGNYDFPTLPLKGLVGQVINGWNLSAIATWQSGFPFTVFSDDDNSFSSIGADRADLVSSSIANAKLSSGRSHSVLTNEWFNTAAFEPNRVGTFGNTGKNALRGPRYFDMDLALLKSAKLSKRFSMQFRAEFYNSLNNVNFGMPDGGLTDSSFGQITSAQDPRILQMALKIIF